MKRAKSPKSIFENPFVKRQNRDWKVALPSTLVVPVSPPSLNRWKADDGSNTAAVEAGEVDINDPVAFFSAKALAAARPAVSQDTPRCTYQDWVDLYHRNLRAEGHHFVIHQHDHPIAGTHYDLRLQCNATSSVSFAIMYGLPGNSNSRRLNRNAIETRVHNLWNHLIETASHSTGSMLIWDTGEYQVLSYHDHEPELDTDGEEGAGSLTIADMSPNRTESEKLNEAFQQRKIRIRLWGTRLPAGYTLLLRLTRSNQRNEQPKRSARRRKRMDPRLKLPDNPSTSDSEPYEGSPSETSMPVTSLYRTASPPRDKTNSSAEHNPIVASEDESEAVQLTNAYPGATNSIGSIHQRKWYLSLDRKASGFLPTRQESTNRRVWLRKISKNGKLQGFEKFWVMGRERERSVVTGRLAKDILEDEGVEGYVPRSLWRPVTE